MTSLAEPSQPDALPKRKTAPITAGKDCLGMYCITYNGTCLRSAKSRSSAFVTELPSGTFFNVLELAEEDLRIRAYIEVGTSAKPGDGGVASEDVSEPFGLRGWITLVDHETGYRWADKVVNDHPEELGVRKPATRVGVVDMARVEESSPSAITVTIVSLSGDELLDISVSLCTTIEEVMRRVQNVVPHRIVEKLVSDGRILDARQTLAEAGVEDETSLVAYFVAIRCGTYPQPNGTIKIMEDGTAVSASWGGWDEVEYQARGGKWTLLEDSSLIVDWTHLCDGNSGRSAPGIDWLCGEVFRNGKLAALQQIFQLTARGELQLIRSLATA